MPNPIYTPGTRGFGSPVLSRPMQPAPQGSTTPTAQMPTNLGYPSFYSNMRSPLATMGQNGYQIGVQPNPTPVVSLNQNGSMRAPDILGAPRTGNTNVVPPVTPNVAPVATDTTTATVSAAPQATTTPTATTTAPVTPQMAAAPTQYNVNGALGSSDAGVYTSPDYIKQLNNNFNAYSVNQANNYAYTNYQTAYNNWLQNGQQGPPPTAPTPQTYDQNQFNTAWDQYASGPNVNTDAYNAAMGFLTPSEQMTPQQREAARGNTSNIPIPPEALAAQQAQAAAHPWPSAVPSPSTPPVQNQPPAQTAAPQTQAPQTQTTTPGLGIPDYIMQLYAAQQQQAQQNPYASLFNGGPASLFNSAGMTNLFSNPYAYMQGVSANPYSQFLGGVINNPLQGGGGNLSGITQLLSAIQGANQFGGLPYYGLGY